MPDDLTENVQLGRQKSLIVLIVDSILKLKMNPGMRNKDKYLISVINYKQRQNIP